MKDASTARRGVGVIRDERFDFLVVYDLDCGLLDDPLHTQYLWPHTSFGGVFFSFLGLDSLPSVMSTAYESNDRSSSACTRCSCAL